jgi:hypothetical protein
MPFARQSVFLHGFFCIQHFPPLSFQWTVRGDPRMTLFFLLVPWQMVIGFLLVYKCPINTRDFPEISSIKCSHDGRMMAGYLTIVNNR